MTDEKMIDINGTKRDTCETSFLTSVQVSLIGSLLRFLVFACLLHRLGFLRQDLAQKERREQMAPLSFTPVRTPSGAFKCETDFLTQRPYHCNLAPPHPQDMAL